jgi:hypothetical protein
VAGHLSVRGSMRGTLGEGSFTGGPNLERKGRHIWASLLDQEAFQYLEALGMGISPYGGSSTRDLMSGMKWALGWSVSLYGSSAKGSWRGGSPAGDPEGYAGKALETGISSRRGSISGNLEEGSSTGSLES